ncbi:MAG: hypothetical protein GX638_14880 [Crenarchaeota archaeon]|nr:hypothetical protein [Thermoproteota archaeon]
MFSETTNSTIIILLLVLFMLWVLAGIITASIKIYDRLKYGKFEEAVREVTLHNKMILEIRRSLRDISEEIEKLPVLKLDHDDTNENIK